MGGGGGGGVQTCSVLSIKKDIRTITTLLKIPLRTTPLKKGPFYTSVHEDKRPTLDPIGTIGIRRISGITSHIVCIPHYGQPIRLLMLI